MAVKKYIKWDNLENELATLPTREICRLTGATRQTVSAARKVRGITVINAIASPSGRPKVSR